MREREDNAARIIAELLTSVLLPRLQRHCEMRGECHTYQLLSWERDAVRWLRAYRRRGGNALLVLWACDFVDGKLPCQNGVKPDRPPSTQGER